MEPNADQRSFLKSLLDNINVRIDHLDQLDEAAGQSLNDSALGGGKKKRSPSAKAKPKKTAAAKKC